MVRASVTKAMMRISAPAGNLVDAGEQQRPGVEGGATVDGFIGGWRRVGAWRGRSVRRRRHGQGR